MREPSEIEKENQRLEKRMAEVEKNRDDVAKENEKILEINGVLEMRVCVIIFLSVIPHSRVCRFLQITRLKSDNDHLNSKMAEMIPKPVEPRWAYTLVPGGVKRVMMSADGKPMPPPPPPKPVEPPVLLPDEAAAASKRVLELEKEVVTLRARIEQYSDPHFKDFSRFVRDAFKDDSKKALCNLLKEYKPYFPGKSILELHEQIIQGSVEGYGEMIDKYIETRHDFETKCKKEVEAVKKQLVELEASMYTIDNERKEDFFKRKFYSLLVCDSRTGEPVVCPITGEVETKAERYEKERNQALAELDRVKQLMPSDETNALLGRAKKKARVFKRKYKYLKTYLLENQYMSSFSDEFCDSDKGHDEDSDDDLRAERVAVKKVVRHDPSIPMGFSVRPASPDP